MLNSLKTLTAADIKVGGEYIHVANMLDCSLRVCHVKVISAYNDAGIFRAIVSYGENSSYVTYACMELLGVPYRPRKYKDNHHRLFAYNPKVYAYLQEFVAKQPRLEWLVWLGVENPLKVIEDGEATVRDMDALDGNHDELLRFMEQYIEKQRV